MFKLSIVSFDEGGSVLEELLNHRLIDDYQAVSVAEYIKRRKENFSYLNEKFDYLKTYKTIIVLALSYPHESVRYKGKGFGLVSRYSYGKDYHRVYASLFSELVPRFSKAGINAIGYADIGPIDERYAGFLSGLGYLGKNQFLIHPWYGTYHYLGILLIDQSITKDSYPKDACGDCEKCVIACPTGALNEGFNKELCTSYVTQAKVALDERDLLPMKTMLFGCDICQKVCPKNLHRTVIERPEFLADEASQLDLIELLSLSNKQIEKRYRDYAFSFRGGLILKRNAIILLYNQNCHDQIDLCKRVYTEYQHVPWFKDTIGPLLKSWEEKQ